MTLALISRVPYQLSQDVLDDKIELLILVFKRTLGFSGTTLVRVGSRLTGGSILEYLFFISSLPLESKTGLSRECIFKKKLAPTDVRLGSVGDINGDWCNNNSGIIVIIIVALGARLILFF